MRYALYKAGVFQRRQEFDEPPPTLAPEKNMVWVLDPVIPPPPPTPEEVAAQTIATLTNDVQQHLDTQAQAKSYDSIVSACSYAGAPNPFQAESQAFVTWRGNVWAKCYAIMADVNAGKRAVPTSKELIAELPAWPG